MAIRAVAKGVGQRRPGAMPPRNPGAPAGVGSVMNISMLQTV